MIRAAFLSRFADVIRKVQCYMMNTYRFALEAAYQETGLCEKKAVINGRLLHRTTSGWHMRNSGEHGRIRGRDNKHVKTSTDVIVLRA